MSRAAMRVLPLSFATVVGCSGSAPPPEVATVPVTDESPSRPPAAPALRNLDEALSQGASAPAGRDGGTFAFPTDAGGTALAKSLAPAHPPATALARSGPRDRKLPDGLIVPTAPTPDPTGTMPRLSQSSASTIRPASLPERVPANFGGRFLDLPPRAELPVGPLTRTESRDSARPPDLPHLATRPVPDRAPLADPTVEFTAASVISAVLPLRVSPAPFLRINLPDPFEHAAAARPRTPVVEDLNRALGTAPPPRRD